MSNDIFRYVEESETELSVGIVAGVDVTPSNPASQDPWTFCHCPDSTSQVEEADVIEEKTSDQVVDERQAGDNYTDILIEADSHINENHVTGAAEAVASLPQEETPKKSDASIINSQTNNGPSKIYVPTNTAKSAQAKAEKQPLDPATDDSHPESTSLIQSDDGTTRE